MDQRKHVIKVQLPEHCEKILDTEAISWIGRDAELKAEDIYVVANDGVIFNKPSNKTTLYGIVRKLNGTLFQHGKGSVVRVEISATSENIRKGDEKNTNNDAFTDSTNSLSHYEDNSYHAAVPQIFASIVSSLFHIVTGISLAYSAILIPQIESPDNSFPVTESDSSWIASILVIIGPFSSFSCGFLMEKIGRLKTIKIAAIPAIAGWFLIATANNVYTIMAGRVILGLACSTSPAVVYVTEVARSDLRGSLLSSCPTLASLGMLIAIVAGAYLNWRMVAWLGLVFTIVPIILMQFFVPESPIWLVGKGRLTEATKSLEILFKKYPQPQNLASKSISEMHLDVLVSDHSKSKADLMRNDSDDVNAPMKRKSKWQGFAEPTGYKPMIIMVSLFFLQQFSGIYITLFYAVTFFTDMGSNIDPYTASIAIGTTRLLMSLLNVWILKRFKRRHLMMASGAGMAICMFVSGLFTKWIQEQSTTFLYVPVVFMLLYVCASMIGLLTIPWIMSAEVFPTEIRGLAHSLSYCFANVIMFAAIKSYRSIQDLLGGSFAIQWFFAVISLCGFFFGLFAMPETHGKKLTEIEAYFRGNHKVIEKVPSKY